MIIFVLQLKFKIKVMAKTIIDSDFSAHDKLVTLCLELNLQCVQFEGVLNDYFFIKSDKKIKVGRYKARVYMVAYPHYLNEWSNSAKIMQTDDEKEFVKFAQSCLSDADFEVFKDEFNII